MTFPDLVTRLRNLDADYGELIEAAADRWTRDTITEAADELEAQRDAREELAEAAYWSEEWHGIAEGRAREIDTLRAALDICARVLSDELVMGDVRADMVDALRTVHAALGRVSA